MPDFMTIDFETRSFVDLKSKSTNAWIYAEHESADILCMAYKINDGPAISWRPDLKMLSGKGVPLPDEFINFKGYLIAHNVLFEYAILSNIGVKRYSFPSDMLKIDRWICTAALCRCNAIPAHLSDAAAFLKLKNQKLGDGARLIAKYSIPQVEKDTGKKYFNELFSGMFDNDADAMMEYNRADVDATWELFNKLKGTKNTAIERKIFLHDLAVNIRGVRIDTESVEILKNALTKTEERARADQARLGVNFGSGPQFISYLKERGVDVPNAQEKTLAKARMKTADKDIVRAFELRDFLAKVSIKKVFSLDELLSPDKRLRYFLKYHGARTGRYSGQGFQPHNMPKSKSNDDKIEKAIARLTSPDYSYSKISDDIKMVIPGLIVPELGQVFLIGDFAAIEARVLAYVANEQKLVKMFQDGVDIYKDMASTIYHCPIEAVAPSQRQLGKSAVLGCIAKGTDVLVAPGLPKKIEDITLHDRLWDGEKWINHGGLLAKGMKSVIRIEKHNIELTPDHLILTERCWQTAVEIAFEEDTLPQRLEIQTEGAKLYQRNLRRGRNAVSWCAAYAELKKNYEWINSGLVKIYYVENVLNPLMGKEEEIQKETAILYLTQNLESVGRHVISTLKSAVPIPVIRTSRGMVVEELPIALGIPALFWNTLLLSMGLMSGGSPSTELITTDTMSPVTYEWLLKKIIMPIKETYDIQLCGDLNSYTAGSCVVHNCGYGMGAFKFLQTCLASGVDVSEELAQRAVKSYRTYYPMIPQYWYGIEEYFKKRIGPRVSYALPSGRELIYRDVRIEAGKLLCKDPVEKHDIDLWGGTLTENVCQAIARDILCDRMLACEAAGLPVVFHTHDEIVCQIPFDEHGDEKTAKFLEIMNTAPAWLPRFPLKTEIEISRRYHK